ncbi:MAG: type I 3-dehydroquinate dehydratase [Pseudobutyrivibrio sp.]|nr:type I 3-dehydroquinate dehydratase [Pseudobutyrivibrio sp.]
MSFEVRNIKIGEGIPKICVPIVGTTYDEIIDAAKRIKNEAFDIVEWRVDFFEEVFDQYKVKKAAAGLRDVLDDAPILFTFRTKDEGGQKEIEGNSYTTLLNFASTLEYIDLIDVEVFFKDADIKNIITTAHDNNTKVVASNHDFNQTPAHDEIISRLVKMDEIGADILKIAVMPQCKGDVITLLSATVDAEDKVNGKPVVTISMGQTGLISRISGSFTSSAITFGTVGNASAPGQIDSNKLKDILNLIG